MGMGEDVISEFKSKVDRTLEDLRKDLSKIRTGRAHAGVLDGVSVDYYGTRSPLNAVASISIPDARLIVIKPFDKSQIATIVQTVAEAPEGGVLFHCAAGRDRTGLMAALMLAVAKVPAPTIVADYILSFSTSAETMEATLSYLDIAEGGVEEFLRTAGVTQQGIERLRHRLRDE